MSVVTTKSRIHEELAKTPGLWLDTDQICKIFPKAPYTTVARALRKLREEGKVISQKIAGNSKNRQEWRFNQAGTPMPTPVPASTLPSAHSTGNGKGNIMSKPTLLAAVTAVLDDFTKASKTFSAHDVTMEIRDRSNTGAITIDPAETGTCHHNGKDVPRINHTEVRDHIHDLFNQGTYPSYVGTSNGTYIEYAPASAVADDDDDQDDADSDDGVAVVAMGGGSYDGSSTL